MGASNEPNQGYCSNTVTMVGLLAGTLGDAISFCRQGDATSQIPVVGHPGGAFLQFPSILALSFRVRAWVSTLATPLFVALMKNGVPARRTDGSPVFIQIPAGSTNQVWDLGGEAIPYDSRDTFDVRLACSVGGIGNEAIVGVSIQASPNGRRYGDMTLTLTGKHDGDAGERTSFCRPGDVTTPPSPGAIPFETVFPAPRAFFLRARAWLNDLGAPLTVQLMKNGRAVPGASIVIPTLSTAQVFNPNAVVQYTGNDTYDVRLDSVGAGAGNSASVAAALMAQDFSGP